MSVRSLGYVGINTTDMDGWRMQAAEVMGLQIAEDSGDRLTLRMDDRACRIAVHQSSENGGAYYGWDVGNEQSLRQLSDQLTAAGYTVTPGDAQLAAERKVLDLVQVQAPGNHLVELFYGQHMALTAFRPGRPLTGFVAGDLGVGHVALMNTAYDEAVAFYELLGLRLSEKCLLVPMGVYGSFWHCNPREHSLALIPAPHDGLHHLMLEVASKTDVGTAHDAVLERGINITMTMGEHVNDRVLSFYIQTPSGFDVEIGSGGSLIDMDQAWEVREFPDISLWGHHGALRPLPSPA